ncbi:hypothetical protein [Nocardia sp. NPDC057227]|uniref:hypothetical protein n=1 Tax=Nocardia sp. NPDC057227 TaxID=3346056 RepID=UPI00363B7D4B
MRSTMGGQREVLAAAYRNARGPVAYLDESYQVVNADVTTDNTFYVLTAVIVGFDQMAELRRGLREIADDDWWHTTEALQHDEGRDRTEDMLGFLAEGPETCVLALRAPIESADTTGESARRSCYRGLVTRLGNGGDDWDATDLIVLEQRNQRTLRATDERTHRELLGDGLIPRGTRLLQTSPAAERLLWLPDVVSSAYRRSLTHSDRTGKFFTLIDDQVHFVPPLD